MKKISKKQVIYWRCSGTFDYSTLVQANKPTSQTHYEENLTDIWSDFQVIPWVLLSWCVPWILCFRSLHMSTWNTTHPFRHVEEYVGKNYPEFLFCFLRTAFAIYLEEYRGVLWYRDGTQVCLEPGKPGTGSQLVYCCVNGSVPINLYSCIQWGK